MTGYFVVPDGIDDPLRPSGGNRYDRKVNALLGLSELVAAPGGLAQAIAAIPPGSTVLVDRNVHKSVVASLILVGANPVWLRPCWDQQRQVAHPATAETVAAALKQHPDASAVVMSR